MQNKISTAQMQEYYPLTASQMGTYLQYSYDDTSFNVPIILDIDGNLDIKRFKAVILALVKRHDALKTAFVLIDNKPMQKICQDVTLSYITMECQNSKIEDATRDFIKPFDLSQAPLARACLFITGKTNYRFVFDMHHIITDGTSAKILVDEICDLYQGKELEKLELQYKDYSVWYNNLLSSGALNDKKEYWNNIFRFPVPALNLPVDDLNWFEKSDVGDGLKFVVPVEIAKGLNMLIRKYIKKYNVTLNTILFAIYGLLLSKYCGQNDFVIGTISAGRNQPGLKGVIGSFINVLPIRISVDTEKSFLEYADSVKNCILGAYENQEYPFEKIIENSKKNSFNRIFDTLFVYHGIEDDGYTYLDGSVRIIQRDLEVYKITTGLKVDVSKNPKGEILFDMGCNAQMFRKEKLEKMAEHFINLCSAICNDPERKLKDINMLSVEDEIHIISDFNNTSTQPNLDISLTTLFEHKAEKSAESTALVFRDKIMSYSELNRAANKVAHFLHKRGVRQDDIIGINADRCFQLIIGILGILKSGAGYCPIQPNYPHERIKYCIKDSGINYVLYGNDSFDESLKSECEFISIDSILEEESVLDNNLCLELDPNRTIYVIYTSGSTGKPKGVMVRMNSFVNLMYWYVSKFNINENDCNLLIAPITFDLAQKNLYGTLLSGGKLCLYPEQTLNYNLMSNIIETQKVTLINCAPAVFYPLIDINSDTDFVKLKSLRCTYLGGESINLPSLRRWMYSDNFSGKIYNTYGPTECTDIATSFNLDELGPDEMSVPIGKPIDNVEVYILDKDMNIVPVGVDGELCIGGTGISKGYKNDVEMTNSKFVEHTVSGIAKKIYRTGDLARWLPDGNIDYRGRIDFQVKINGLRIELEEIERILLEHEKIKNAVVVDKTDDSGTRYLCAYIIFDEEVPQHELVEFMQNQLPDYMMPARFIALDKMPLSYNGKVDRNKLKSLENSEFECMEYAEPENDVEYQLVNIWKEVLGIEKIGVLDSLFNHGCNSLKIIVGTSKIEKVIGVQISALSVFKQPTIRGIAHLIFEELDACNSDDFSINFNDIEFEFDF